MAAYDENELNVADGLEYSMNMTDFYVSILDTYVEETTESIAKMDGFCEAGDMPSYATLVHAIKSSSRLIGANLLGEEAYDLEMRAKDGDAAYIKEKHQALKDHLQVIYDCIEGYKSTL